mmetsp:Transcript_29206/g.48251  ORF Transcript_29206/g.48251 Transcript_29206/m.48251 type:complete len:346 (+) Transcript_29206:73-1110(+)
MPTSNSYCCYIFTAFLAGMLCSYNYSQLVGLHVWLEHDVNCKHPEKIGREYATSLSTSQLQSAITIIMPTYKRPKTALATVNHYRCMKAVSAIIVRWNDPTTVPPRDLLAMQNNTAGDYGCAVSVLIMSGLNNINNRFEPIHQVATEAVLSLDDDVEMTERSLDFAYKVWKENRERLVGFQLTSRAFLCKYSSNPPEEPNCHYSYFHPRSLELEPMVAMGVNVALTGATLFAKHYLKAYFGGPMELLRQHVSEIFNCEDILMNSMIVNLTRKGPLIVPDEISSGKMATNAEKEGLNYRDNHIGVRNQCGKLFATEFPKPLLRQAMGVIPGKGGSIAYCNRTGICA